MSENKNLGSQGNNPTRTEQQQTGNTPQRGNQSTGREGMEEDLQQNVSKEQQQGDRTGQGTQRDLGAEREQNQRTDNPQRGDSELGNERRM